MYLSKLVLNTGSRVVRRDMADCQQMHRTVMSAFPNVADNAARRHFGVLFRVDLSERTGIATLLVQSQNPPDWSELPPDYLDSTAPRPNPACKSIGHLLDHVEVGRRLRFRLVANATRKVGTSLKSERIAGKRDNGRRVPVARSELDAWLSKRGAAHGFRVIEVTSVPGVLNARSTRGPRLTGRKRPTDGSAVARLTFSPATFEGLLEVTDGDAFQRAIREGIGPAKAYGFGLLSIAPAG